MARLVHSPNRVRGAETANLKNHSVPGKGDLRPVVICVSWLVLLAAVPPAFAQAQVGDQLRMNASGLITFGYAGNYGNEIASNHSLTFGADGNLNGSYHDPNFLNFTVSPYYNQSRADSNFQSLTDSSGVTATVNLFSGSHFPGYASYRYDHNSTGTFGVIGQPNFTTVGNGQGFSVGWSELLPNWPTLSANYTQGSGNGTIFGTNQETGSNTHTFNLHSTYLLAGFRLNGYYDNTKFDTVFPEFLTGVQGTDFSNSHVSDYGFSGTRNLPWHGALSANYNHIDVKSDFGSSNGENASNTSYTTNSETAYVSFHPTLKLGLFADQSYISNLSGYFYQGLINVGGVPPVGLGSSSHSTTFGGGANYQFTKDLTGQAQATYYNQAYLGNNYTGTYVSGTLNYGRRLWDLFTFSASVIQSSNGQGNNGLGFILNMNYYHRFGRWETSGSFSYAQNVQSYLITYTTSYYNYSGNIHRRFWRAAQWTAAFNGTHNGFTNQPGSSNHTEVYSTSLSTRVISVGGNYSKARGESVLTSNGLQPLPPIPGLPSTDFIVYNGTSYGGGISLTPISRLTLSGSYSHTLSSTLSNSILSNNKTQILASQLQYRFRRISLLAGYTQFSQGISASGLPAGRESSYFVGVSRWINFF